MTSADLQRFIDDHGIDADILPLSQPTPTVTEAAAALGVETHQVIKTLVFRIKEAPLLVITNGESRIDRRKLADYLAVGRGQVRFASADQVLEMTGYVVGTMPPFGHRMKLRTILDDAVTKLDTVYGGGGDINAMMRVKTSELQRVTAAETAPLSEDDGC
jgi:Cys-tRNA(Pro) deacylase